MISEIRFFIAIAGFFLACMASAAALPLTQKSIVQEKPAPYRGTIKIHIAYPQTGIAAIDQVLADYAESHRDDVSPGDFTAGNPGAVYPIDLSYKILRNDSKMLAVQFSGGYYTGGAHGLQIEDSFNFLLPDGARVFLPELVDGQRGIDRISRLAIADLVDQAAPAADAQTVKWIQTGAGPLARNFTNFAWLPNMLVIDFPPYQVAAYAFGTLTVHIPLTKLADVIRPDPRAPAPGFSCADAQSQTEKAICGDVALARLDRQVAERYGEKRMTASIVPQPGERDTLLDDQRAFLASRATCGADSKCLTDRYKARLKALH